MRQRTNHWIVYTIASGLLFCFTSTSGAQTSLTVGVPSQLSTARTAFIANAGAPPLGDHEKEATRMAYESAYKALKADGHYQLTATPAEAELAFEVSIGDQVGSTTKGDSYDAPYLRWAVFDVKTHCLLWNIDAPLKAAFRASSFRKNIDDATGKVLADLHLLIAGKQP